MSFCFNYFLWLCSNYLWLSVGIRWDMPPFFFFMSICFLRNIDLQYLLCTTGSKQGPKGGILYTHLLLDTDTSWFFARARLLAAIWLIIAAMPLKILHHNGTNYSNLYFLERFLNTSFFPSLIPNPEVSNIYSLP